MNIYPRIVSSLWYNGSMFPSAISLSSFKLTLKHKQTQFHQQVFKS